MARKLIAAALALAFVAGCAPAGKVAPASKGGAGLLLVGNKGEDSLSFIDLATGNELARAATGRMPHEIAISPDGRRDAVVAYGGTGIDTFDIASRTKLRTIELVPNQGPHGLVWLDDGRLVATAERSQTLVVVDTANGDRLTHIDTGQRGSHMVAVSADKSRAYTANIPAGTVTVIDLQAARKLRDIAVGGNPEGLALAEADRTLWVADLQGARVQAFDTQSFERLAGIATGPSPIRVLTSPDGRWVVTSNLGDGSLTVIDAATRRKVRDIKLSEGDSARQVTILFSRDGRLLYVAETGPDTVAEVDFASGRVLRRLKAGNDGDGLAIAY